MSTTLPANWERICGARFRRPKRTFTGETFHRLVDATQTRNLREFHGCPPGSLLFRFAHWDENGDDIDLTVDIAPCPDLDGDSVAYLDHFGEPVTVPISNRTDFADIFAGWELVGYLYRE